VGRSLRKRLRRDEFELTMDTAFEHVIRACATVPRADQDSTWITDDMQRAYTELHRLGYAHSVEVWREGELVGGLYGVSVGGMFAGESMFSTANDASKVALVRFAQQLERWDFSLIDAQFHTDHLARLGAFEIPRRAYLERLALALRAPTRPGPWRFDGPD
jgi:leucyl/phenylalanyl-tRNA--protein transferase